MLYAIFYKKKRKFAIIKKRTIYNHFIIKVTFLVTLSLFAFKPIISLVNHLADNSSDIELMEDIDEESSEKETEKETEFDEIFVLSKTGISRVEASYDDSKNDRYIHTHYFIVYSDILIPPPKA